MIISKLKVDSRFYLQVTFEVYSNEFRFDADRDDNAIGTKATVTTLVTLSFQLEE